MTSVVKICLMCEVWVFTWYLIIYFLRSCPDGQALLCLMRSGIEKLQAKHSNNEAYFIIKRLCPWFLYFWPHIKQSSLGDMTLHMRQLQVKKREGKERPEKSFVVKYSIIPRKYLVSLDFSLLLFIVQTFTWYFSVKGL